MRITRAQAINWHNVLSAISRGQKDVAPDIPMRTYLILVEMIRALAPVVDDFEKARANGFKNATAGNAVAGMDGNAMIGDPVKQLAFNEMLRDSLAETISVRPFPKPKLPEADLKLKENGIPAALAAQMFQLIEWSNKIEMMGDEDEDK